MTTQHTDPAADIEAAWHNYEALRAPLKDTAMLVIAELQPVTGLAPDHGAMKLADQLIELCVQAHAEIGAMHAQRQRARAAELRRDANTPPPPPAKTKTTLDKIAGTGGDEAVREWLKMVDGPEELLATLAEENAEDRQLWAVEMLAAARADGATHGIIAALEAEAHGTMTAEPESED